MISLECDNPRGAATSVGMFVWTSVIYATVSSICKISFYKNYASNKVISVKKNEKLSKISSD